MNKRKLLSYFLQDQAGDAAAAGGAAAPDPGAAPAAGSAPAGAAPAAGGTALEQGASAPAPDPGAPAPITIPEKYLVKKEDGTIDQGASSLKLAEAYVNLEKRVGTGISRLKRRKSTRSPYPNNSKNHGSRRKIHFSRNFSRMRTRPDSHRSKSIW